MKYDRKFYLYSMAEHASVLIRSSLNAYHDGQMMKYDSAIDIQFKNVAALAIARSYFPLEVAYASENEADSFCRFLNCEIGDRNLYVLRGGEEIGYVLASVMFWVEDRESVVGERSVLYSETPQPRLANMVILQA